MDILKDVGLTGAKPSKVPIEHHHNLLEASSDSLSASELTIYRRLVGRLIYLTITRPNIAYSVQVLSQFLTNPTSVHLHAALKLVRYLKQAPGQDFLLSASSPITLTAFCDSNWGGCKASRTLVIVFSWAIP